MSGVLALAATMTIVLLFVLALVGGLTMLSRGPKKTPEQLLAERFAKGEIDEEEYTRRLSVLRMGPPLELP